MNKLLKLANASENHNGAIKCDLLESLILEASIEFLREMKNIGNDNQKVNKKQLVEIIENLKD